MQFCDLIVTVTDTQSAQLLPLVTFLVSYYLVIRCSISYILLYIVLYTQPFIYPFPILPGLPPEYTHQLSLKLYLLLLPRTLTVDKYIQCTLYRCSLSEFIQIKHVCQSSLCVPKPPSCHLTVTRTYFRHSELAVVWLVTLTKLVENPLKGYSSLVECVGASHKLQLWISLLGSYSSFASSTGGKP